MAGEFLLFFIDFVSFVHVLFFVLSGVIVTHIFAYPKLPCTSARSFYQFMLLYISASISDQSISVFSSPK